ncbi:hypothetical protein ES702_05218 [subsurface metagenome]
MEINVKVENYSKTEVIFNRDSTVIVCIWTYNDEIYNPEANNIQLFFENIKDYSDFKNSLKGG